MTPSGFNPILIISGNYNYFNSGSNLSGIYAISGLSPSNLQTPIYIGSSIDFKKRAGEHKNDLKANRHANQPLQNYYNKNGSDSLVYFQIDGCFTLPLIESEQNYINYFGVAKKHQSFNACENAGRPPSSKGRKVSEKTKQKLKAKFSGENNPNFGKTHSSQTIEKMRKSATGRKFSDASINKRSSALSDKGNGNFGNKRPQHVIDALIKSKSKSFKLLSPNGKIIEGTNLEKFARENNLSAGNLRQMIKGNFKQTKGWRVPNNL